jgi:AraC-like DNA-binding protein
MELLDRPENARIVAVIVAGVLSIGIGVYVLVSFPLLAAAFGSGSDAMVFVAALNPVFFWWFVLALFDDRFEWRYWYTLPLLAMVAFHALGLSQDRTLQVAGALLHQLLLAGLLLHAIALAVSDLGSDLIDARRRFRVALAMVISATGLAIVFAEVYGLGADLPGWTTRLHAVTIFTLSFGFALWLNRVQEDLVPFSRSALRPQRELLSAVERLELNRLEALVDKGACLEADLSIASLAKRVGVPGHRLRRLISRGLGYRNFSTFVNDHRIEEAKQRLADPKRAREQVIAVAFGLGYSSLPPFNRAFRQRVGMSPSEYRAKMLRGPNDSAKD